MNIIEAIKNVFNLDWDFDNMSDDATVTITQDQFDKAWNNAVEDAGGKLYMIRLLLMTDLGLIGKIPKP